MSYGRIQLAENTPFNPGGSTLGSLDAENAIKEIDFKVESLLDPSTFPDTIDFHSGFSEISAGIEVTVKSKKQSITWGTLTLSGSLNLEGGLWMA